MVYPRFIALLCCGLLTLSSAAAPREPALSIQDIRVGFHGQRTRVVFDLSGPAKYRSFTLDDPSRLVLDLENVEVDQPIKLQRLADTPIAGLRSVRQGASKLRLVFDFEQEVAVDIFAVTPSAQQGDRVVLDFHALEGTTSPELKPEVPSQQPKSDDVPPQDDSTPALVRETPIPVTVKKPRNPRQHSRFNFSGTWEHEAAINSSNGETQKFESVVEPRLDIDLSESVSMTVIARIRADGEGDLGPEDDHPTNYSSASRPWGNSSHASFSLRELYFDAHWGDAFWRVGKQQVVWGQADGIKVMDVVNPQSFREFILDDFDDSRIPLWMINAEFPIGEEGNLQLLWIPDTTYHELPEEGTPYAFTSANVTPETPQGLLSEVREASKPNDSFSDSDAGFRYSTFAGGWDITANYLYHYQDFPVPYQQLRIEDSGFTGILAPAYERNHMLGSTLSNVFGSTTFRAEMVYNSDTFHLSRDYSQNGIASSDEFTSVFGLDYQMGTNNAMISAQWFQSHLLDYNRDMLREQTEHKLSLMYRRSFSNDAWQLQALGLYSANYGDRWLQLRLSHTLSSNLEIWLGSDVFDGSRKGLFGQYSDQDRVVLGFELGF